jgi:hypothetical protein
VLANNVLFHSPDHYMLYSVVLSNDECCTLDLGGAALGLHASLTIFSRLPIAVDGQCRLIESYGGGRRVKSRIGQE